MIKAAIAGLLQGICNIIMGIFAAKQAKENEYKVLSQEKQMASIVEGKEVEVSIVKNQSELKPVATLTDFKKAMTGLCFLAMLMLTGCVRPKVEVTNEPFKPLIRTEKAPPEMFEGPEELTPRETAMSNYVLKLRAGIGTYNSWAKKKNLEHGYPDFDEPPQSGLEILIFAPPKKPGESAPIQPSKPVRAEVVKI